VSAFASATPLEKSKKAKSVRKLAKRLLAARVRFLKARLSAATDPALEHVLAERAREIATVDQALSTLIARGVEAILKEFAPQEVVENLREP
jgi:hypothetical protein